MRTLAPVDLDFFETASRKIVGRAHLSASPDKVFASFARPDEWRTWFPMLRSATWINGEGGLNSEREVKMGGGLGVFRERFIAWQPGVRFSFTMFETSSPLVTQMGEDYRLSPDGTGTQLDWVMAATLTTLGTIAWPATKALMGSFFRRGGKKLEAHLR
ncbi:MAG: SRPBCC family protein [Kofleriaceae bacterium]